MNNEHEPKDDNAEGKSSCLFIIGGALLITCLPGIFAIIVVIWAKLTGN